LVRVGRSEPQPWRSLALARDESNSAAEYGAAPELAHLGHAVTAGWFSAVGQAEEDAKAQPGATAQYPEFIRPCALDHRASAGQATKAGDKHKRKKEYQ